MVRNMGAVAVAQHLHSMTTLFTNNDVQGARDAWGGVLRQRWGLLLARANLLARVVKVGAEVGADEDLGLIGRQD